jgi:hypothetical protein
MADDALVNINNLSITPFRQSVYHSWLGGKGISAIA